MDILDHPDASALLADAGRWHMVTLRDGAKGPLR